MNPYKKMLENEIFQYEDRAETKEKKALSSYVPSEKVLNKLLTENKSLINFINKINPFASHLYFQDTWWKEFAVEFKKVFPLNRTTLNKLGLVGEEIVLAKWAEGIEINIRNSFKDIHNVQDDSLTADDFINVFASTIVEITRIIAFAERVDHISKYLTDISLHAAQVSDSINYESKLYVSAYFNTIIKNQDTSSDNIALYNKLKLKILDSQVQSALDGTYDYKQSTYIFSNIDTYLSFISIDKDDIFKKAKIVMDKLILDLDDAKTKYEMLLSEKEEHKDSAYKPKQEFRKKLMRAEIDFTNKKKSIKSALISLSKLQQ